MKMHLWIWVLLGSSLLFSCQDSAGEKAVEEPAATEQTQTEEREVSPPKAASVPAIPAVAWSKLQALVPTTVAGMPRTNPGADKSDLGQMDFSHAVGIYEKDGRRIEVEFWDCGNQKTLLAVAAPWLGKVVEFEDEAGFELSITVKGHPAIEQIDKVGNIYKISAVVNDRFVVMVAGTGGVQFDELRKVMDGLDLAKLEKMQ